MSHMTTNPRLALVSNDAGELVPSMNLEGLQDVQVAGTVLSLESKEYVNEASGKTYYRGKVNINNNGVEERNKTALFAGSTIESVTIGEVYWITIRESANGRNSNLSCGGLAVDAGMAATVATDLRAKLLADLAIANQSVSATA